MRTGNCSTTCGAGRGGLALGGNRDVRANARLRLRPGSHPRAGWRHRLRNGQLRPPAQGHALRRVGISAGARVRRQAAGFPGRAGRGDQLARARLPWERRPGRHGGRRGIDGHRPPRLMRLDRLRRVGVPRHARVTAASAPASGRASTRSSPGRCIRSTGPRAARKARASRSRRSCRPGGRAWRPPCGSSLASQPGRRGRGRICAPPRRGILGLSNVTG